MAQRGFPTLDSIRREAERRGFVGDLPEDPKRWVWLLDIPGFADLAVRVPQLLKDEKRRSEAVDIDWSKMSAVSQSNGSARN